MLSHGDLLSLPRFDVLARDGMLGSLLYSDQREHFAKFSIIFT